MGNLKGNIYLVIQALPVSSQKVLWKAAAIRISGEIFSCCRLSSIWKFLKYFKRRNYFGASKWQNFLKIKKIFFFRTFFWRAKNILRYLWIFYEIKNLISEQEGDCEEVGTATVDLELILKTGRDLVDEKIDVFSTEARTKVGRLLHGNKPIGILTVSIQAADLFKSLRIQT